MCGRFELHTNPAAIALAFGLAHPPAIAPRYNIAPMQDVPVIRATRSGERELAQVRWGLVPRWAKDPSIGARMINARAETVAEKPSFRIAFQRHRCLIPADGFYEWKPGPAGKQPIRVGMKDERPFAFAGLTERWLSPGGEVLDSCTIVTTTANALLATMHDRMPVIVAPSDYARWLDVASDADVTDLLAPYPADAMTWYPVSTRVNSVRHDDAALIEQVAEADATANADEPPPAADDKDIGDEEMPPEQTELF
jgi:putative SOS response-associated peptidase YedK